MQTARQAFEMSNFSETKVFAAGGFGTLFLNSTEIYNIPSKTWTTVSPLATARQAFKLIVV